MAKDFTSRFVALLSTGSLRKSVRQLLPLGLFAASAFILAWIVIKQPLPDTVLPLDLNPVLYLKQIGHAWFPNNLGQRRLGAVGLLPMALLYSGLNLLGGSLMLEQRIWLGMLFCIAGIGMVMLFQTFWQDTAKRTPYLAGALYVLSPYVLLNLKGATSTLIPYSAVPLVALVTIRLSRRPSLLRAFMAGITIGALVPAGNLTEYLYYLVGVLTIVIIDRNHVRYPAGFSYFTMLLSATFIGMLWWLLPSAIVLSSGGSNAALLSDPLSQLASSSSYVAAFQQTGLWALSQGWQGVPYYPEVKYLSNPVVLAYGLIPILACLVVFWKNWKDTTYKLLAVLLVTAIVLSVSIYPPDNPPILGRIYLFLYNHVFAFKALREPFKATALTALVASLVAPKVLGYRTITSYTQKASYSMQPLWNALLLGTTVIYLAPFVLGGVFPTSYKLGNIPPYWTQASNWLDAHSNGGRVLFLPSSGASDYRWGFPQGDLGSALMTTPDISPGNLILTTRSGNELLNLLATTGTPKVQFPLDNLLNLFHIKYVVVQNDFNSKYYSVPSGEEISNYLSKQSGIKVSKSFGKLKIYQVHEYQRSLIGSSADYGQIEYTGGIDNALWAYKANYNLSLLPSSISFPGGYKISSSSIWRNFVNHYGPWVALINHAKSSLYGWASNSPYGKGAWLQISFPKSETIGSISIRVRHDAYDAVPKVIEVDTGTNKVEIPVGPNNLAVANFGSLKARHIRISIVSHGPGAQTVAISHISCTCISPPTFRITPASSNGAIGLDYHTPVIRNIPSQLVLKKRALFHVSANFTGQIDATKNSGLLPGNHFRLPVLVNGKPMILSNVVFRKSEVTSGIFTVSGTLPLSSGTTTIEREVNEGTTLYQMTLSMGFNSGDLIHWDGHTTATIPIGAVINYIPKPGYVVAAYNFDPWWNASVGNKPLHRFNISNYYNVWKIDHARSSDVHISLDPPAMENLGLWLSISGLALLGLFALSREVLIKKRTD